MSIKILKYGHLVALTVQGVPKPLVAVDGRPPAVNRLETGTVVVAAKTSFHGTDSQRALWRARGGSFSTDVLNSMGKKDLKMRSQQALTVLAALVTISGGRMVAQSLNWEGQTGVFVTPLAYTAASPEKGIGKPILAYHFLNAGSVLGNFHTASATVGLVKRVEFGYTRTFSQQGNTASLSPLWDGGFNIVHAKANLVPENAGKNKWLPAISTGFVARSQVHHVSGVLAGKDYSNADFYAVATKTVTQTKAVPILLSVGYKATNASVFGLAGNSPAYKGRLFGAGAFVFKTPRKSTLILGSEFAQQPREVRNLPGAIVPTTITYAARFVPRPESKFNIDLGVAQAAGKILPGVDLKARHQFALGISYGI
ncbi:MAG: DUF3034 family protein [Bryobacteraceae bacterium]